MDVMAAHDWMARLANPKPAAIAKGGGRRRVFELYSGHLSQRATQAYKLFNTLAAKKLNQLFALWQRVVCKHVRGAWARFQMDWAKGPNVNQLCTS